MKKSLWISVCLVTMLVWALKLNSRPATLHKRPQPPTPEPCVAHLESPNYPQLARNTRIEGKITVSVSVYRDGTFSVAKKGKGHPLLLGAAQENLKTWRFKPNDSPEAIPLDVEYEFVLEAEHPTDNPNAAPIVTLDLPRHVKISAPAQRMVDSRPVEKRQF